MFNHKNIWETTFIFYERFDMSCYTQISWESPESFLFHLPNGGVIARQDHSVTAFQKGLQNWPVKNNSILKEDLSKKFIHIKFKEVEHILWHSLEWIIWYFTKLCRYKDGRQIFFWESVKGLTVPKVRLGPHSHREEGKERSECVLHQLPIHGVTV